MGLAEISPNNPLKVIHSQFDKYEDEKYINKKISFLGISNWAFDTKMNRGVHISVQEPDAEDLELTAQVIAFDIYEEIENNNIYKNFIINL